jgi:peptidoglycan/xylan/chitin deacetylase (PgdA/CDA1 family)
MRHHRALLASLLLCACGSAGSAEQPDTEGAAGTPTTSDGAAPIASEAAPASRDARLDGASGATDAAVPADAASAWTGKDNVAPSQSPPGGLDVARVPQFVTFGFDDNGLSGLEGSGEQGGLTWATQMIASRRNPAGSGQAATYDGAPISMAFYGATFYVADTVVESPTYVRRAWHTAFANGNEWGSHTNLHQDGSAYTQADWTQDIGDSLDWLSKPFDPNESPDSPSLDSGPGIPRSSLYGFRTPYGPYNNALFPALVALGFRYDASLSEGWESGQNGTNQVWPYTLDNGSPGNMVQVKWGQREKVTSYPGLWEMPQYAATVPPDDKCAEYGVSPGLRTKLRGVQSYFDPADGVIASEDWVFYVEFKMTAAEALATLKYSLDLRLSGNRAPFAPCGHSDIYSSAYKDAPQVTYTDRQKVIEDFVDYALSKPDVRIVSPQRIIDWMRSPAPLR